MNNLLFLVIVLFVVENFALAQTNSTTRAKPTICKKKEDLICLKKPASYCKYIIFKRQCPRKCKLCVDKPALPKHLVSVNKARSAINDVVQNVISSSILTSNASNTSTNLNQVNDVMYQIERFMGQADLSRKKYKLPELKSDIKEGVKLGNVKFARRTLAIALNTIGKSSSAKAGRRRRSTKLDAKKFLEDLRKDLGEEMFSKLFALEGGKTLMFAIDITGSMHNEIESAKAIATEISTFKRRLPPKDYILSWFSDPLELGGIVHNKKDEVNAFINNIGNLKAYDGGDCPEYALEGMFSAIDEGPEYGSPLFTFTDASPKDGSEDNMALLLALAEENGVTINFFVEEGCQNPPDSTFEIYKTLAAETGGNYLRIKETELKRLANFTDTKLGTLATVKSGGTVSKTRKKRSTMDEILIPLDDSVEQLIVSTTTESSADGINLQTPNGIAWTKGVNRFSNVVIYIVDSPIDGNWKLQVPVDAGKYRYSAQVSSTENINFNFIFTKKVNRKVLELKYPINGEPAQVSLTISGAKQIKKNSLYVDIVDIDGKVLIPDLKPTSNDESGLRYSLTFNPPKQKFKMMMKGRTNKNKVFQRLSQQTSEVKQLVLKEFYNSGSYAIRPGGSAFIILYLFNGMDTDQVFSISFRDTLGYKVTLLGSRRTIVRAKAKRFLRVAVRYGGGKIGKVGQNENVIVLVKDSGGRSVTEIIPLMVKK